jgi:hypothetical protein
MIPKDNTGAGVIRRKRSKHVQIGIPKSAWAKLDFQILAALSHLDVHLLA